MKEDSVENKIAEIKQVTVDSEETKKYIIKIKNMIDNYYQKYGGEVSKEEIWESFVEDYNSELAFKTKTEEIYNAVPQYVAMEKLISAEKGDRYTYNYAMKKARALETINSKEGLNTSIDTKETMIVLIRLVLRYNLKITEKEIMETIAEGKEIIEKDLRKNLIANIQFFVSYLNEYGYIDEYIDEVNKILEDLNLDKVKFEKRNPLPDVQYDEDGKVVKDVEDIGVIDAFEENELEKNSIGDLVLMAIAWESEYWQARMEMEKAIITIDSLNLYEKMINGDIKDIEDLPLEDIEKALKRDLALTFIFEAKERLCSKIADEKRKNNEYNKQSVKQEALEAILTSKLKRQYKKILKENGFDDKEILSETLENINLEYENLYGTANDITILQGLLIYLIKEKAIKIKKWGTIDPEKIFGEIDEDQDAAYIAIENPAFRGPLVMVIPKELLESITENKVPEYKGYLNEKYCEIMARLAVPSTPKFVKEIKNAYKEKPTKLNASLAGKSISNLER